MKHRATPVFALLAAFVAAPAWGASDTAENYSLKIEIDDGTPEGRLSIDLDDATESLDLHEMQVGESRSIVDENGRSVLITRLENGFEMNVDGKVVELPALDDFHHTASLHASHVGDIDVESDHQVFVMKAGKTHDGDAITILSGAAIDDVTREGIRSLLSSAGHDTDVIFIDGTDMHGDAIDGRIVRRHVEVISKEVNATQ